MRLGVLVLVASPFSTAFPRPRDHAGTHGHGASGAFRRDFHMVEEDDEGNRARVKPKDWLKVRTELFEELRQELRKERHKAKISHTPPPEAGSSDAHSHQRERNTSVAKGNHSTGAKRSSKVHASHGSPRATGSRTNASETRGNPSNKAGHAHADEPYPMSYMRMHETLMHEALEPEQQHEREPPTWWDSFLVFAIVAMFCYSQRYMSGEPHVIVWNLTTDKTECITAEEHLRRLQEREARGEAARPPGARAPDSARRGEYMSIAPVAEQEDN
jgi:hypothetical protein